MSLSGDISNRQGVVDDFCKVRGVEEIALIVVDRVTARHIGESKINMVGMKKLLLERFKAFESPGGHLLRGLSKPML